MRLSIGKLYNKHVIHPIIHSSYIYMYITCASLTIGKYAGMVTVKHRLNHRTDLLKTKEGRDDDETCIYYV
jgi:hypothetical protein